MTNNPLKILWDTANKARMKVARKILDKLVPVIEQGSSKDVSKEDAKGLEERIKAYPNQSKQVK